MYVFVHVSECIRTWAYACTGTRRGRLRSLGAELQVAVSCELPSVGARNAIRVLMTEQQALLMAELSLKPHFTILISYNILSSFFIFSFKSWEPFEMRQFTIAVLEPFALKSPFIYTACFSFWDKCLSIAPWWSSGPQQGEWALFTAEPSLHPLYSSCFTEDLEELSIIDSACVLLPSYSVCFMVVGA